MRIIAGNNRGAKLTKLDAANTRPTKDSTRESLFNILNSGRFGQVFANANVIDAFAGTGALGLEALSRGAACVSFVEHDQKALTVLRANINRLDMHERTTVLAADAKSLTYWSQKPASIMFADAPYYSGAGQIALTTIQSIGGLAAGAIVILETHKNEKLDITLLGASDIVLIDSRVYGNTAIHFLMYKNEY